MELNEFAVQTLRDRYMISTDVTPEDVFYRSVDTHCSGEHLERMRMYIDKQWFVPGYSVQTIAYQCTSAYVPDAPLSKVYPRYGRTHLQGLHRLKSYNGHVAFVLRIH